MKKMILISTLVLFSCKNNDDNFQTSENKSEEKSNHFFENLKFNEEDEKIILLSITKNVSKDSLRLIIKDYLSKTEGFIVSKKTDYDKILDTLAFKYNIPKLKLAQIIYSYKYEKDTKDEDNFDEDEE